MRLKLPGKGGITVPVDSLEPPVVLLKDDSVVFCDVLLSCALVPSGDLQSRAVLPRPCGVEIVLVPKPLPGDSTAARATGYLFAPRPAKMKPRTSAIPRGSRKSASLPGVAPQRKVYVRCRRALGPKPCQCYCYDPRDARFEDSAC